MWGADAVTIAGKRLECRCWGPPPGEGPTLILLHEGLGCVALWRDFPEALQKVTGYPVLAYSRAGYGGSDPDDLPRPLDWMGREAVETLPRLLAAFNLRNVRLVGHSDGATIAAHYAADAGRGAAPNAPHLGGLVLMAPHSFTEAVGLAEIARARDRFAHSDTALRMAKYHRDPAATFSGWADAWLDPDFERWTIAEQLRAITCPVLAIQGRQDEYGTLAQIDAITDRVSGARALILEACGHAPQLEHPDQVLREIGRFMHQNA